jgi:hypothetical protein
MLKGLNNGLRFALSYLKNVIRHCFRYHNICVQTQVEDLNYQCKAIRRFFRLRCFLSMTQTDRSIFSNIFFQKLLVHIQEHWQTYRHGFNINVCGEALWQAILPYQQENRKWEKVPTLWFENEQFNVLQELLIRLSHAPNGLSVTVFCTKIRFNLPASGGKFRNGQ